MNRFRIKFLTGEMTVQIIRMCNGFLDRVFFVIYSKTFYNR